MIEEFVVQLKYSDIVAVVAGTETPTVKVYEPEEEYNLNDFAIIQTLLKNVKFEDLQLNPIELMSLVEKTDFNEDQWVSLVNSKDKEYSVVETTDDAIQYLLDNDFDKEEIYAIFGIDGVNAPDTLAEKMLFEDFMATYKTDPKWKM